MKLEKLAAKNGEFTLKAEGLMVYSKYKPIEDAQNFIRKEFKESAEGYLLIGLGLGYHLSALYTLVGHTKNIVVYCLSKEELTLYSESIYYKKLKNCSNISIVTDIADLKIELGYQIIIPNVWLQVMKKSHPLYPFLADIKIKQVSYERFAPLMTANFKGNVELNDFHLLQQSNELKIKRVACLVASGPSLNETKQWLKLINEDTYVIAVGSALKPLLQAGIKPDAVIITDSQSEIAVQLDNCSYDGELFYLCTADYHTVSSYKYKKCILLQNGYGPAEKLARQLNYPLLDTGGSVATTAFSLLKYLNFETVILFGQDLGFAGKQTHAINSTSGREVYDSESLIEVTSNDNDIIFTTPNLNSYLKWFEQQVGKSKVNVYNTARQGAKIKGIPFIEKEQFMELVYLAY